MTMWEFLDKNVDTLTNVLGGLGIIVVTAMVLFFLYKLEQHD